MSTTNTIPTLWQRLQNWMCNLIGCPASATPDPNPPASVAGFEINGLSLAYIPDPNNSSQFLSLLDVLKHNIDLADPTKLQVLGWFIDYRGSGPDISPTNIHQLMYRKDPYPAGLNRFFIIPASFPLNSQLSTGPWSGIAKSVSYKHYRIQQTGGYDNVITNALQVPRNEYEFEDSQTKMCFFSTSQLILMKSLIEENSIVGSLPPQVIFSGYEIHYGRLASPQNSKNLNDQNKRKTNQWFTLKAEIILPTNPATGSRTTPEEASMAPYSALGQSCPPTWHIGASAIQIIQLATTNNSNQRNLANSSTTPTYTKLLRQVNQKIDNFLSTGELTSPEELPIEVEGDRDGGN